MHLQVSIVLLCILLTGGFSLRCCTDQHPHCSKATTCYKDMCRSTKIVEYFGPYREEADNWQRARDRIPNRNKNKHALCPGEGIKTETITYGCMDGPHECNSWSLGTGCWIRGNAAKCCNTDRCNNNYDSDFSQIPNGKRCFTCDEEDCTKTINCWGNEDYCFIAYDPSSHQSVATKGCASKSVCDKETGKILGLSGNISCCEGNLCNNAQSVTQRSMCVDVQRVTQRCMCDDAQSATQSFIYDDPESAVQSFLSSDAQRVTQSFLFLCGSLLFYFLLH